MLSRADKVRQYRTLLQAAAKQLADTLQDDSEIMSFAAVFPQWESEYKQYKIGDIVQYGENQDGEPQLYRCLIQHTSQPDWTPDIAISLFKAIGFTEDNVPIWTQPVGASDAYMAGDRVSHNNKIWVSTVDNNVWEPGIYGWDEET